MKLRIFYSWQTDTDPKDNRYFISSCIEKAVNRLTKSPEFSNIEFEILDGVRGLPGSPRIASTITDERIPSSDIFIADLSIVNNVNGFIKFLQNIFGTKFKAQINNNVINEHGVALNALGLPKIIGVLNSQYGSPKGDPRN